MIRCYVNGVWELNDATCVLLNTDSYFRWSRRVWSPQPHCHTQCHHVSIYHLIVMWLLLQSPPYYNDRKMSDSGKLGAAGVQEVLYLQSTHLLRKYGSFVEAAWTSLTHRNYVLSSTDEYWLAKQAMEAHYSQFVWFRRLYVLFSRYMLVNSFTRLRPASIINSANSQ